MPVRLGIIPGIQGEILTRIHHRTSALAPDSEAVAPGTIRLIRPDGHSLLILAVSLRPYGFSSFSYLNETRKAQLAALLKNAMSVFCRGDAEVMAQSGRDPEGNRIVILHAMSPDGLERPELVFREPVSCMEHLQPDGSWKELPFDKEEDAIRPDLSVKMLYPEVLRVR